MRRMAGGEGEAEEGYKEVKAADAAKAKTRKERKEAERAAKTSESVNLPAGAPPSPNTTHHPIIPSNRRAPVSEWRVIASWT
jgi:hypothetical protein